MKKSKVLLLSLGMALCVGGGVGAAVAITRNAAGNGGEGDFDKIIALYWGNESSTATLDDMEELSVDVPQYRYLSVTPKSSKSVEGTVNVKFALTAAAADKDIAGITINVYKTEELADDDSVEDLIDGVTPSATITKANPEGTASFTVSASTVMHVTNAYYAIKVVYDGSAQAESKTLGGSLSITQEFGA